MVRIHKFVFVLPSGNVSTDCLDLNIKTVDRCCTLGRKMPVWGLHLLLLILIPHSPAISINWVKESVVPFG